MKPSKQTNRKPMIKIKGGYSERSGEIRFETAIQVEDLDDKTRAVLSNCLFETIKYTFKRNSK